MNISTILCAVTFTSDVALQTFHGWMIRAGYQNLLDNTSRDDQSILLGVEKKFGP